MKEIDIHRARNLQSPEILENSSSLKFYNWELCSTIDPLPKIKTESIYSENSPSSGVSSHSRLVVCNFFCQAGLAFFCQTQDQIGMVFIRKSMAGDFRLTVLPPRPNFPCFSFMG